MFVIIDWMTYGFVHDEDGNMMAFADEESAEAYAEAELQMGLWQVIPVPIYIMLYASLIFILHLGQ